MGELQRIDRLSAPPVVGQFYLVPTVWAAWLANKPEAWPVIGAMHSDVEFFAFPEPHYHVDGRFLRSRWHHRTLDTPLTRPYSRYWPVSPDSPALPKPVWRRRKCRHTLVPYVICPEEPETIPEQITNLRAAFAGHQCERGKGGWICPHRKASLGSVAPIDGIITCPLHGLRIDAASGMVLGKPPFSDDHSQPTNREGSPETQKESSPRTP